MALKKRRLISCGSMDAEKAKAMLAAAAAEELGREIRVFTTSVGSSTSEEAPASSSSQNDEPDDFYEFSPEDYYRIISDKMGAQFLKTRKIREKEAAARRSRITKAVIRVRFPDDYILEAKFHPSETIQSLMDLLAKVIARPDVPFYIFTTPPKERITDMSKDFYTSGFAPGAIVYFSYDLPKEADGAVANSGPFLRDDIQSLNGLNFITEQADVNPEIVNPEVEPVRVEPPPAEPEPKPVKKTTKPKWLKM